MLSVFWTDFIYCVRVRVCVCVCVCVCVFESIHTGYKYNLEEENLLWSYKSFKYK